MTPVTAVNRSGSRAATWLVLLLILTLPFNGLISRLDIGGVGAGYGAIKDAIAALLLLIVLGSPRRRLLPARYVLPILAFVTVGAVSIVEQWTGAQAFYGWRNDFYPMLILLAVPALLDERQARKVASAIGWTAQVSAVIGIATWRRGVSYLYDMGILPPDDPDLFPFQFFVSGSVEPRAFSPYVSPNEAGVAHVLALTVIWTHPGWSTKKKLLLSAAPLIMVAVTQSRSAMLGVVCAAVVLLAWRFRSERLAPTLVILTAGATGLAGLVAYANPANYDLSIIGHGTSVAHGLQLITENPLGTGVGTVGPRAIRYGTPYYVESFWLLLALEAGVVALALFLVVLWRIVRFSLSAGSLAALGATLALAGSLVSQLVLPTVQEGAVSYLLWVAVSLGLVRAFAPAVCPSVEADDPHRTDAETLVHTAPARRPA